MRGGSIPLLAWGLVLFVALVLNWIWTQGDAIQVGMFGFAVVVIWGFGLLFAVRSRRESLHRGAPTPSTAPQTVPEISWGAFGIAAGVAAVMFGFEFGRFLVYFGAGLLIASLGLVVIERRGERRAQREFVNRERR